MDVSSSSIGAVQLGMKQAANSYGAFKNLGMDVAAKTGTAQENINSPDHALIIAYAPFEEPEISLSVMIQNGYTSTYSTSLSAYILKFYFVQFHL